LNFDEAKEAPQKYYVDNVEVWISVEQVMELDPDGHVLRTMSYEQYVGDQIRRLMPSAEHCESCGQKPRGVPKSSRN
jgi:hypothetical protein